MEYKPRNAINLFAPDLKPILAGADSAAEPEPDEGVRAKWDQANSRLFSLLFFVTSGSAHATVLTYEEAADGTAAWKALNERFDAHIQEARCACQREFFGLRYLAGGDLIDFFTKIMDLKIHLQSLGGEVSERVYLDIMLSGLTKAPEFSSSVRCTTERNSRPLTVSRRRLAASTWTSTRATRRGPWPRAGEPKWRRPHRPVPSMQGIRAFPA